MITVNIVTSVKHYFQLFSEILSSITFLMGEFAVLIACGRELRASYIVLMYIVAMTGLMTVAVSLFFFLFLSVASTALRRHIIDTVRCTCEEITHTHISSQTKTNPFHVNSTLNLLFRLELYLNRSQVDM